MLEIVGVGSGNYGSSGGWGSGKFGPGWEGQLARLVSGSMGEFMFGAHISKIFRDGPYDAIGGCCT